MLTDCLRARAVASGLVLGPTQTNALETVGLLHRARRAGSGRGSTGRGSIGRARSRTRRDEGVGGGAGGGIGGLAADAAAVDGVYLHGPAGRGKTWLLDGLVACWPGQVRRYHWAEFFTRLDAELGRRLTDPQRLPLSLDAVVGSCDLLCFDELEITDPDDAGLVEHLLLRLAERGTLLVLTSNQAPDSLLADPRWQHWAAGLRRRLLSRFAVCLVDDGVDYRTLGGTSQFASGQLLSAGFLPPGSPPASSAAAEFVPATDDRSSSVVPAGLVSLGRPLPVLRAVDGTLWADFRALLSSPTGRQDYLLICGAVTGPVTLGLTGVPPLAEVDADTRQRFTVLIDVAYDTDTRLLLALADPPDWSLLPARTASRLSLLRSGA